MDLNSHTTFESCSDPQIHLDVKCLADFLHPLGRFRYKVFQTLYIYILLFQGLVPDYMSQSGRRWWRRVALKHINKAWKFEFLLNSGPGTSRAGPEVALFSHGVGLPSCVSHSLAGPPSNLQNWNFAQISHLGSRWKSYLNFFGNSCQQL